MITNKKYYFLKYKKRGFFESPLFFTPVNLSLIYLYIAAGTLQSSAC